jgi:hypothetical protein
MNRKVWIINDGDMGESSAKRLIENRPENRRNGRPAARTPQKNPALAFSLSLLVWGSGHLYIREYRLGSIYLGCMLLFYSAIILPAMFGDYFTRLVFTNQIPVPALLGGAGLFFSFGLACWLYGSVDAYFRTESLRTEPFRGAVNELWPLLCSLCLPGWGQFLNGQPKKGLVYLISGAFGIFSLIFISVVFSVWPILSSSSDRFVFEMYLHAALLVFPICILMWLAAAHDSFWSCREPVRKRPFRTRFQFARERIRTHGLGRYLIPKIKGATVFGVLLVLTILAGRHYFPKSYYLESLERIRVEMMSRQMKVIPELVEKAIVFLG